jgi:FkbH-like protein
LTAPAPLALDRPVKLIVWDLDDTLWNGVLMEGDSCAVIPDIAEFIRETDSKGILHSIASRNDAAAAAKHLEESGLSGLFLHPQIGWAAKSLSIRHIAERLNIGLDSVVFIDDSEFELAEAAAACPDLRTLNVARLDSLKRSPDLAALGVTEESRRRREMYRDDMRREDAEREFADTPEAFLATLGLHLAIRPATARDLDRAEELIQRTNQLNSTGRLFSRPELAAMIDGGGEVVLVASLEDRFGDYGIVALVVLREEPGGWSVELILVSCRVMSRGIGPILLDHLAARAEETGKAFRVEFSDTGRNRAMKVALMMTGFVKAEDPGRGYVRRGRRAPPPSWLRLTSGW